MGTKHRKTSSVGFIQSLPSYLSPYILKPLHRLHKSAMIHFVLLQNRQGKTRLAKWYTPYPTDEKRSIEVEIHRMVTTRDQKFTNFIEWSDYKIVYRRYAGLFFSLCIDTNDNELAYLESIHLFVELLDSFFGNVCELDLVFNFHKVLTLVDEFYLAGEIQETAKPVILMRIDEYERLEAKSKN